MIVYCLVAFPVLVFSNSQLDKEKLTSDGEPKDENKRGVGREGVSAPAPASAASGAATASGFPPRHTGVPYTAGVDDSSSSNVRRRGEDSPLLTVYPSLDDGEEDDSSYLQGGAGSSDEPRAGTKKAKASTSEIERANRAPLRFFLVREGHKFVPVGGNRRKGAWRELPSVNGSHGVPVVLDPSPYQVCVLMYQVCVLFLFRLFLILGVFL